MKELTQKQWDKLFDYRDTIEGLTESDISDERKIDLAIKMLDLVLPQITVMECYLRDHNKDIYSWSCRDEIDRKKIVVRNLYLFKKSALTYLKNQKTPKARVHYLLA